MLQSAQIPTHISAYKRQMGAEYEKLHPEIQKRFDFSTSNNIAFIGRGVMERIWNGNKLAVFVLKLLSKSNILFLERVKISLTKYIIIPTLMILEEKYIQ
jgi:hypothetical protein